MKLLLACLMLCMALPCSTRAIEPVQILAPSDAAQGYGDGFGQSVAINGDWLVVGAPYDDQLNYDAGAAYVFRRQGARWVEHQKIGGYALSEDHFGRAVAIDGDRIVVGGPHDAFDGMIGGGVGNGVIYQRQDYGLPGPSADDWWVPVAILHPPPSQLCCNFGGSVAIHGDVVVVGSVDFGYSLGHAYVFQWDGAEWRGPETLVGSDTEAGDKFGASVATWSGTIVVAASHEALDPSTTVVSGSIYIVEKHGRHWAETQKLTGSQLGATRYLGSAFSLSDGFLAIGGVYLGDGGPILLLGAAYLFERQGALWTSVDMITKEDLSPFFGFATSLAADTQRVVIGSTSETWANVFERDNGEWVEVDALLGRSTIAAPPIDVHARFAIVSDHIYAVGSAVTLVDFAAFQNCVGTEPLVPACGRFDFEADDRVDARDLPLFVLTFRQP